jgi:predicted acylesterase/phospholipase RssA
VPTGPVEQNTFEIALVLAGAVMGGSYTAGVLDFLFEALDAWERARDDANTPVPNHRVRIRIVAGASSGSLTTLAGTWTMLDREHSRSEERALHALWVHEAKGELLLRPNDLRPDQPLRSLFDGTVFDEALARIGAHIAVQPTLRPWIDPHLELLLTTTSLRGVPYGTAYHGGVVPARSFGDYVRFRLNLPSTPDAIGLPLGPVDAPAWMKLREAALASSAFPLALPSRLFTVDDIGTYDDRVQIVPPDGGPSIPVPPDWPDGMGSSYTSLFVDGGAIDNTPLELARQALAGGPTAHNPRSPAEANRAVVLVNPFPGDGATFTLAPPTTPDMLRDLQAFAKAVIYQNRFLPEEIALAESLKVASRFLVAPTASRGAGHPPLASAPLGSFAGALDEAFRAHDFALGRRNCQHFLRSWFVLDPANTVFGSVRPEPVMWGDQPKTPIIPLLGSVAQEVPAPRWPQIRLDDLDDRFRGRIRSRVGSIVDTLLTTEILGLPELLAYPVSAVLALPLTARIWRGLVEQLRAARLLIE